MTVLDIVTSVRDVLPHKRRFQARWERFLNVLEELIENPLTLTGLVIVVVFIAVALLTPVLVPGQGNNPYQMPRDWESIRAPPGTPGHPLGTTRTGGDVLYGILWGARLSIALSLAVVVSTTIIGVTLGGIAGFLGGWIDELIMRVVDAMIAIPAIIWAIAIGAALGPSILNIGIALATMLWGTYARIIRGEVIHVKTEAYVDAARVTGSSNTSIFLTEVVPNAIPPIFVQSTLYFGRVVLIAAAVSFIGLSEAGLTEWGRVIAQGQNDLLAGRWWTSTFPGIAIFLWAFGWNMIGDGLRDVLDPKKQTE